MKDKDNLKFIDKIINLISSKDSEVKSYCRNCHNPIFTHERFEEMGLCVYCCAAYKEGRESITVKYPEQITVQCRNCKNITTCRDRPVEVFKTNKTALCCDNPDYSYYFEE